MAFARSRIRTVRTAGLLVALVVVAGLSACAVEPAQPPGSTPDPSSTATSGPTGTSEPDDPSTRIDVECAELVNADVIYAFNPNFVLDEDWTPAPGSAAADALDEGGIACRWINQTSGDAIDVSVASLPDPDLTELKNEAFASSEMVPTYGEEAYFSVADGAGTAIVFDRSYWLVATSPAFFEPGEATDIIEAALAALP